jgi:hypothetical protein
LDISKMLQMLLLPCCCVYVPFASKTRKIEYARDCGLCSCPYRVELDGVKVGKVRDVGCCDNGCMFVCCPWLTCGGHVKIMGMDGTDGQEKFVFAKELFPCWPLVSACALGCAPLGMCVAGMDGCLQYCNGREFKSITQPVFKGPWNRSDGEPHKVGQFVITQRYTPACCCLASPTPLQYYFEATSPEGQNLAKEDRVALSLALQLYRGMPVPFKCCSSAGFQMPYGICCTDVGLMTTTTWSSVQEVLARSH